MENVQTEFLVLCQKANSLRNCPMRIGHKRGLWLEQWPEASCCCAQLWWHISFQWLYSLQMRTKLMTDIVSIDMSFVQAPKGKPGVTQWAHNPRLRPHNNLAKFCTPRPSLHLPEPQGRRQFINTETEGGS